MYILQISQGTKSEEEEEEAETDELLRLLSSSLLLVTFPPSDKKLLVGRWPIRTKSTPFLSLSSLLVAAAQQSLLFLLLPSLHPPSPFHLISHHLVLCSSMLHQLLP